MFSIDLKKHVHIVELFRTMKINEKEPILSRYPFQWYACYNSVPIFGNDANFSVSFLPAGLVHLEKDAEGKLCMVENGQVRFVLEEGNEQGKWNLYFRDFKGKMQSNGGNGVNHHLDFNNVQPGMFLYDGTDLDTYLKDKNFLIGLHYEGQLKSMSRVDRTFYVDIRDWKSHVKAGCKKVKEFKWLRLVDGDVQPIWVFLHKSDALAKVRESRRDYVLAEDFLEGRSEHHYVFQVERGEINPIRVDTFMNLRLPRIVISSER